jgi:hypothetical protein
MAFAQNPIPTFAKQPQAARVQILPADTTTVKTIVTAGANGSKIIGVIVTSTDTSARDLTLSITNSTTYPLGTKTIAITAGTIAATPAVNLLDAAVIVGIPKDSDGNPFLFLISGDTLTVNCLTTVTTAKAITIHAIYEDF